MARRQRDAEVGHQRAAVVQQDVLRLDVAVDDVVPVGVVERAGDLRRDAHRVVDRELLLPLESVAQRLALDERHHVVEDSRRRSPESNSGRMCGCWRLRGGPDLGQEPLGAEDRGQLRA